jgi:uncharacterized membrane protein YoaK (UPF0700 family)
VSVSTPQPNTGRSTASGGSSSSSVAPPAVPILLSLNAGYVDTAGFLALQGLFTAHVTGNFVTLGASLVLGTSGAAAKLLALPVFCLVVISTRIASLSLPKLGLPIFRTMIAVKVVLLVLGAILAIRFGPFARGDGWPAILTGMVFVSAMAIQNAAHRIHMSALPPTTLMTGTTTQIMIDVADLIRGIQPDAERAVRARLGRMSVSVCAFAVGCAGGAFLYAQFHTWCFILPPLLATPSLFLLESETLTLS